MTKNMYIQPSVSVTEIAMVNALCVSGAGGGAKLGSSLNSNATTDMQL